jgi:TonB family protein
MVTIDTQKYSSPATRRASRLICSAALLALFLGASLPAFAAGERGVKSRVAPVYPELAKRMKIGGSVQLEAVVDAKGAVTSVKTLEGNRMLGAAAEEAVKKWKFEAGEGNTTVHLGLNFALPES